MAKVNKTKLVGNVLFVDDMELATINKLVIDTSSSTPKVRLSFEISEGVKCDVNKVDVVGAIYFQGLGVRVNGEDLVNRIPFEIKIQMKIGISTGIAFRVEGKYGSRKFPSTELSSVADIIKLISGVR